MPTDVESNPLFPLLTDALRAGPGSPEWHQAVAKLRADGLADGDEYRLLIDVREHLAAGRDYRSVRAGPGFTRKVMAAVEQERQQGGARPAGGPSVATVIATVSVLAVVGVLGYLGYQLFVKAPATPPQGTADELADAYFPREDARASFDAGLPAGWRQVGGLPLEAKDGLRPQRSATTPGTGPADPIGGTVASATTVGPDEAFEVEVKLKPGKPTDDLIVQVFVSGEGDFSPDKSTSSKELAWLLQGAKQKVVLAGEADSRVLVDAPRPEPAAGRPESMTVRVKVNREFAAVFNGPQKLWAGPNGLGAKPRTVGVRFLRVDPTKAIDPSVVQSIRVLRR